jgi:hypothetical protein
MYAHLMPGADDREWKALEDALAARPADLTEP